MSWSAKERAAIEGRAFELMLKVKSALLQNMIIHPRQGKFTGGFTIRAVSEDAAASVIERALMAEQRRVLRPGRLGKRRT